MYPMIYHIYIYIYTCIHIDIHIYTRTYIYTHAYPCMHIHTYVRTHAHIYTHILAWADACICTYYFKSTHWGRATPMFVSNLDHNWSRVANMTPSHYLNQYWFNLVYFNEFFKNYNFLWNFLRFFKKIVVQYGVHFVPVSMCRIITPWNIRRKLRQICDFKLVWWKEIINNFWKAALL